jgi:biopolymer transport protein ExbD
MIKIFVPKDEDSLSLFSSHYILNLIKNKKQVQTELDDDKLTNQKKLSIIQYQARKLKYSKDTNSVINISITKKVSYSEVLQLLNICFEDGHKRFALLKNRFVIFGEYPSPKGDTTNIIKPIYL